MMFTQECFADLEENCYAEKAVKNQKQNQTILLVDDDPSFRQLLCEVLAPCGFAIAEAGSAEQALEHLSGRVCLATVDFRLPDMDGMTFISKMREKFPTNGLFSQMNVVSVLGKLLCARFTAEVLRGRWDDNTFAVATACDDDAIALSAL